MQQLPKAIFFDFDGVILESADIKTEAFIELFTSHPEHLPAIKEYHLQNLGVSRFKKFDWIYQNLFNHTLSEEEMAALGDAFSKIVFDKVVQSPFVPGAQELLEFAHKNILCFVASGTPEEELKQIVIQRKLYGYFREVCGTPRTKSQIVTELSSKYNLMPDQCWFIGDANTDHEAAKATGLSFIARNTEVMREYWTQQENIWLVDSLHEVKDRWIAHER